MTGLRLADGREVVVKARPPTPRLRGWAAWDHDRPGLWPLPDDRDGDLDDHPGLGLPPVVGHADWESQNIRWRGDRPLAVHDWDSAVAQTEQFLSARGRPWTPAERQACWAAGLWVRAFNAKKQRQSGGGPQLERLAAEVGERAARAGLEVAGVA